MKTIITLLVGIAVGAVAKPLLAEDAHDRISNTLKNIHTVSVKVFDRSTQPGLPNKASIQTQIESLLQQNCGLQIVQAPAPADAEVHVDVNLVPVPATTGPTTNLVYLRTSIWRSVAPTSDPTNTNLMTGWMYASLMDLKTDSSLGTSIGAHVSILQVAFRNVGQGPLPAAVAFFQSRVTEMETNLEKLINDKVKSPQVAPAIKVKLSVTNLGVLQFQFRGTVVQTVPNADPALPGLKHTATIDQNGSLDLVALAEIGALANAQICLNDSPPVSGIRQCVTIADIFQVTQ